MGFRYLLSDFKITKKKPIVQIAIFVQLIKRHYFVVVCSSKMIKRQNFVIKIFEIL